MKIEFKLLASGSDGGHRLEGHCYGPDLGRQYTQLRVIAESGAGERIRYTILFDGAEFSPLACGGEVFQAAARHLLAMREGNQPYPIYITNLDLSRLQQAGAQPDDTIRLLQYKRTIEERFDRAMRALRRRRRLCASCC